MSASRVLTPDGETDAAPMTTATRPTRSSDGRVSEQVRVIEAAHARLTDRGLGP